MPICGSRSRSSVVGREKCGVTVITAEQSTVVVCVASPTPSGHVGLGVVRCRWVMHCSRQRRCSTIHSEKGDIFMHYGAARQLTHRTAPCRVICVNFTHSLLFMVWVDTTAEILLLFSLVRDWVVVPVPPTLCPVCWVCACVWPRAHSCAALVRPLPMPRPKPTSPQAASYDASITHPTFEDERDAPRSRCCAETQPESTESTPIAPRPNIRSNTK